MAGKVLKNALVQLTAEAFGGEQTVGLGAGSPKRACRSLDLLERDAEGRLVVVDLKTAARKFTDLQAEMSLQQSVYSYATTMNGFADQDDVRLRVDVLTKTRQPELCRYWTTRDRAANVRLFRLALSVVYAIEAGVFHPNAGWQCKECPFRSKCWAWGEAASPSDFVGAPCPPRPVVADGRGTTKRGVRLITSS